MKVYTILPKSIYCGYNFFLQNINNSKLLSALLQIHISTSSLLTCYVCVTPNQSPKSLAQKMDVVFHPGQIRTPGVTTVIWAKEAIKSVRLYD